jgi:hypothetical protein
MSNYPKHKCPRTGIQFEGNLLPKELGIVPPPKPEPPAVLTNPRQGIAAHGPDKRVQAGVTPQGIAFQGDEVVSRLDGQPPVGGSAHSFLTPGGSFSTRGGKVVLINMTMDGVLSPWRGRVDLMDCLAGAPVPAELPALK